MFEGNGRGVARTILALARLEEFLETALTCLQEDGSGSIGGHRQKLYLDTLTTFLSLAHNKLIAVVGKYVEKWCPADFCLDSLSIDSTGVPKHPLVEREGTMEIYIPSMQRRVIAVAFS